MEPKQLYRQFDSLRYLYRFALLLRQMNQSDGLLLCWMLHNRAQWQRRSDRRDYIDFTDELDLSIARAMAAGTLMDDWVAEQASMYPHHADEMRLAWLRVAAVITTYLIRTTGVSIDIGIGGGPDYQRQDDDLTRLEF